MKIKRAQSIENNLDKEEEGGLTDFKPYYITTVIKTLWYAHKGGHFDYWNGFEIPEINSYIYGGLIILTR